MWLNLPEDGKFYIAMIAYTYSAYAKLMALCMTEKGIRRRLRFAQESNWRSNNPNVHALNVFCIDLKNLSVTDVTKEFVK